MGSSSQSIKENKKQVREAWKSTYPKDVGLRKKISQEVCQLLSQQGAFRLAPQICLFAGRDWEIDLAELFQLFPRSYHFPKVDPSTKTMRFYEVHSLKELELGAFGIYEPQGKSPATVLTERDLVLVPGYSFDHYGYRIGSGGGYYDRFFSTYPKITRWGVCFQQQISKLELAHTDQDARMDAIISEVGFFKAKKVE
jgi:5-formyltetrahydrofolate cyclo-ligase